MFIKTSSSEEIAIWKNVSDHSWPKKQNLYQNINDSESSIWIFLKKKKKKNNYFGHETPYEKISLEA